MAVSTLVSIIIPCYNHGRYLATAIESVLIQNHKQVELIVVDDGSTDNTQAEAEKYPAVRYLYQNNLGLSAARNAGIELSKGAFLVFLDADDWLFPDALSTNLAYLQQNEKLAFVSGAHQKINAVNKVIDEAKVLVIDNHYNKLLHGNYIEMHATVMYRRWAFDGLRYDILLKACEDYDIYLKIARKFPVTHHNHLIAAYRIHDENMSGNLSLMLITALTTLNRQRNALADKAEMKSFLYGKRFYIEYYCNKIFKKNKREELKALWAFDKSLYFKYFIIYKLTASKTGV